jgi:transposase
MQRMSDVISRFATLIVVIVFIIALLLWRKLPKSTLADHYDISMPTLGKWVEHFDPTTDPDEWNRKRKLTVYEIGKIKEKFGEDETMALTKGEIAQRAESTPKTVAQEVKRNLDKLGLTLEAWNGLNRFPPKISKNILDHLG